MKKLLFAILLFMLMTTVSAKTYTYDKLTFTLNDAWKLVTENKSNDLLLVFEKSANGKMENISVSKINMTIDGSCPTEISNAGLLVTYSINESDIKEKTINKIVYKTFIEKISKNDVDYYKEVYVGMSGCNRIEFIYAYNDEPINKADFNSFLTNSSKNVADNTPVTPETPNENNEPNNEENPSEPITDNNDDNDITDNPKEDVSTKDNNENDYQLYVYTAIAIFVIAVLVLSIVLLKKYLAKKPK